MNTGKGSEHKLYLLKLEINIFMIFYFKDETRMIFILIFPL